MVNKKQLNMLFFIIEWFLLYCSMLNQTFTYMFFKTVPWQTCKWYFIALVFSSELRNYEVKKKKKSSDKNICILNIIQIF